MVEQTQKQIAEAIQRFSAMLRAETQTQALAEILPVIAARDAALARAEKAEAALRGDGPLPRAVLRRAIEKLKLFFLRTIETRNEHPVYVARNVRTIIATLDRCLAELAREEESDGARALAVALPPPPEDGGFRARLR
jgi:hypothetical protein